MDFCYVGRGQVWNTRAVNQLFYVANHSHDQAIRDCIPMYLVMHKYFSSTRTLYTHGAVEKECCRASPTGAGDTIPQLFRTNRDV